MLLTLLASCSGWNVDVGGKKTPHSRVLASFSHLDQDDEADLTDGLQFDLVRRQRNILVEKKLYENGKFSATLDAGHRRQQRWFSGLSLHYNF